MRSQLDQQSLRLRLNHAEFAQLLKQGGLQVSSQFLGLFSIAIELQILDQSEAKLQGDAGHWRIGLPRKQLQELAGHLPSRDGLTFALDAIDQNPRHAMQLIVDIDVRDRPRHGDAG